MSKVHGLALAFLLAPPSSAEQAEPDLRIERLAVIHVLAATGRSMPGFEPNSLQYSSDVLSTFSRFRKHAAVTAYSEAVAAGLRLPEALQLAWEAPSAPSPWRRALEARLGRRLILRLVEAWERFDRDSGFESFFRDHGPMLRRYGSQVGDQLDLDADRAVLEAYAGQKLPFGDRVVLSPLLAGRFGDNFRSGESIVWVVGPDGTKGDSLTVHPESRRLDRWRVWSHILLDPALESYPQAACGADDVDASDSCTSNWALCVREHAAEAVSRRLAASRGLQVGAAERLPWLNAVQDRLKQFEEDRDRYKTLAAFYPRLVSALPGFEDGSAAPSAEAVGRSLGDAGVEAFEKGRLEEALLDLSKGVALAGRDGGLRLNYGVVLMAAGRVSEAGAQLGEAVRLAMDVCRGGALAAEVLSTRASLRLRVRMRAEAAEDLRRALELAPPRWPRRVETEARLAELGGRP